MRNRKSRRRIGKARSLLCCHTVCVFVCAEHVFSREGILSKPGASNFVSEGVDEWVDLDFVVVKNVVEMRCVLRCAFLWFDWLKIFFFSFRGCVRSDCCSLVLPVDATNTGPKLRLRLPCCHSNKSFNLRSVHNTPMIIITVGFHTSTTVLTPVVM